MILPAGVQVGVVGRIVVALCEKLRLGTVVTPRLACCVCQTGNDGKLTQFRTCALHDAQLEYPCP